MLTCGKGQRIGIFAGSGVGKSTLLGMIARSSCADVNVIGLIGERGREVREFIEKRLGDEGMARSVLVVATSDQPSIQRLQGAMVATTIAEYFRDAGRNVLLMMDSVTRFAMGTRDRARRRRTARDAGYTPSVFSLLPQLLERSGAGEQGTITGLFTVLVEADDMNDPIADAARGILDGHIVFRAPGGKRHYPAIDVLPSVSRLMTDITSPEHQAAATRVREILATYKQSEDLIFIGAYVAGQQSGNRCCDSTHRSVNEFLMHPTNGAAPGSRPSRRCCSFARPWNRIGGA